MTRRILRTLVAMAIILFGALNDASAFLSSYSSSLNNNDWQGYKTNQQNGYDFTLIFNVYDNIAHHSEVTAWAGDVAFPDRYVYAYQLFVDQSSTKEVTYFGILDIAQARMHVTQAVGAGVMPDPNPSTQQGEWRWSSGGGFISAGEFSAYLLYSSPYAPIKAKGYISDGSTGIILLDIPAPIPEPATLLLLGLGGLVLRKHRT